METHIMHKFEEDFYEQNLKVRASNSTLSKGFVMLPNIWFLSSFLWTLTFQDDSWIGYVNKLHNGGTSSVGFIVIDSMVM